MAVIYEIARNRHCGLQLLEIAFEHEKQILTDTLEVLDLRSQNASKGGTMLAFLFVMTQDANVFLCMLNILVAVLASQLLWTYSDEISPLPRKLLSEGEAIKEV